MINHYLQDFEFCKSSSEVTLLYVKLVDANLIIIIIIIIIVYVDYISMTRCVRNL